MKVKVSELTRDALNWAVAKAEEHESRCAWMLEKYGYIAWQNYEQAWGNPIPSYSMDGGSAVPIIEREGISVEFNKVPFKSAWVAYKLEPSEEDEPQGGSTFLIAAMRCYCCAKLGNEIEIPQELYPCQQLKI